MTRTPVRVALGAMLALIPAFLMLAYSGCSKQTEGGSLNSGAAVSNPSNFPLYQPSTVVSVAPVDYAFAKTLIKNEGGTRTETVPPYRGNEVLATTGARLADLDVWLKKLEAAPPRSFTFKGSASPDIELIKNDGVDDAAFDTDGAGRAVWLIVMDPKQVKQKFGVALDLIDKYQTLPAALRSGIDENAKKQLGFSITQMLDKSNPLGLVIAAVRELGPSDKRAIILVDESKY